MYFKIWWILLIPIAVTACTAEGNELVGHPSPYLAMHAEDPVQWKSWGFEAVNEAKQKDKLMFISSGYFSCHWCHVMQRESYKNDTIAKLLNDAFVPIKVDRELEPVLDEQLIHFTQQTRGQGGWPLNVFVTPEGYPLLGVLYVPADQFKDLLIKLNLRWQEQRQALKQVAANAAYAINRRLQVEQRQTVSVELAELEQRFLSQTMLLADELGGGFGQQNKFPSAPKLVALLKLYAKYRDEQLKEFLLLTLHEMASKGLRDQLGGGFYRYTIDPGWRIPHFEKMLYDNAQHELERIISDLCKFRLPECIRR